MLRILFLLVLILPAQAFAACDIYGNCGEEEQAVPLFAEPQGDNDVDNSFPDRAEPEKKEPSFGERLKSGNVFLRGNSIGSTTGSIDGENVWLRTSDSGRTTGTIGDRFVNMRTSDGGRVSGTIGDDFVDMRRGLDGSLRGTIGDEYVVCRENSIGITRCH